MNTSLANIFWYVDASYDHEMQWAALCAVCVKNGSKIIEVRKIFVKCKSSVDAEMLAVFLVPKHSVVSSDCAPAISHLHKDPPQPQYSHLKSLKEKHNITVKKVKRDHKYLAAAHGFAIRCMRVKRAALGRYYDSFRPKKFLDILRESI